MCYCLLHTDGVSIRRVSDAPFASHYLTPEGIYTSFEVVGKTKAEFHAENTSPIKSKRKDQDSPIESFYKDTDGDWKRIVKMPNYEFTYVSSVVKCAIGDESVNRTVATAAELVGTK